MTMLLMLERRLCWSAPLIAEPSLELTGQPNLEI